MKGIKHLLIAPPLAFLVAISVVPLIFTLVLSLTNYSIGGGFGWIGFDNYLGLFKDLFFLKSYVNTFVYVLIGVAIQYRVGLGLALLVNSMIGGKRWMRLLILLPFMVPPLIVGFLWKTMFARYGPLSAINRILHVPPILWLNDPILAFISIVIVDTWQVDPLHVSHSVRRAAQSAERAVRSREGGRRIGLADLLGSDISDADSGVDWRHSSA